MRWEQLLEQVESDTSVRIITHTLGLERAIDVSSLGIRPTGIFGVIHNKRTSETITEMSRFSNG